MCKTKISLFVVRTVVYIILFVHLFSTSVTVGIRGFFFHVAIKCDEDVLGLAVGQKVFAEGGLSDTSGTQSNRLLK